MKLENAIKNATHAEFGDIKNYQTAVIATDKFLSGWGGALGKTHKQVILCRDSKEAARVRSRMQQDNSLKYVNFFYLNSGLPLNGSKHTWSIRAAENCPLWNK